MARLYSDITASAVGVPYVRWGTKTATSRGKLIICVTHALAKGALRIVRVIFGPSMPSALVHVLLHGLRASTSSSRLPMSDTRTALHMAILVVSARNNTRLILLFITFGENE